MLLMQKKEGIGTLPFVKTLGGAGDELTTDLGQDRHGNNILVGSSSSVGTGGAGLIAKFSRSGSLLWQKYFDDTNLEVARGIGFDRNQNIFISGEQTSQATGDKDLIVMKMDKDGTLVWQKSLGTVGESFLGNGCTVNEYGDVFAAGVVDPTVGSTESFLMKYTNDGTLVWQKRVDDNHGDGISQLRSYGNYLYAIGYTNEPGGGGEYSVLVMKIDFDGNIIWERKLGHATATVDDRGNEVVIDSNENVIVSGRTREGVGEHWDAIMAKYNSSGVLQWQRLIGQVGNDETANSVSVDSADNIYMAGRLSITGDFDGNRILLLKYNSSGVLQWKRKLQSFANERSVKTVFDTSWVYVAGYTTTPGATDGSPVINGPNDCIYIRFPDDGTGIGTYGDYVYSAATVDETAGSMIDAAAIHTFVAGSFTETTPTYTLSNSTFTLIDHT